MYQGPNTTVSQGQAEKYNGVFVRGDIAVQDDVRFTY